MSDPLTFTEAVKAWLARQVLPTDLDSAGIAQQISAAVRRKSIFSAETTMVPYLQQIQSVVESAINPKQQTRFDEEGHPLPQTVTVGLNPATARQTLRDGLSALHYTAPEGLEGTIKDLSSDPRINLVVDTNTKLALSAGHLVQSNLNEDVLDLWPAWEFIRVEDRKEPRNWPTRWRNAAEVSGDSKSLGLLGRTGRMCALKSSGLWIALGEGAGGYDDCLGDGLLDPVAWGTGMEREELSREESEDLGLLEDGQEVKPAAIDLAALFGLGSKVGDLAAQLAQLSSS